MKIGRRFATWIVVSALVIAGASSVLHYKISQNEAIADFEGDGKNVARVVEISLTDAMLQGTINQTLQGTLEGLSEGGRIEGIWITDTDGIARVGNPKEVIGTRRPMDWSRKAGYYFSEGNIFHWVQPVRNRPICHRCHGAKDKYNGAIMIDFSTAELQEHVRAGIMEGFTVAVGTVGIIALLVLGLSRSLITKRLGAVIEQIGHVRDGNYDASVKVKGNDEISELSSFFNEMADAVRTRNKERDLLFKQISQSYKMWQATFDSITDMIAIVDEHFNISMANQAFMKYFGIAKEDLKSRKCYEVMHESDMSPAECPHLSAIMEGKPDSMEYRRPGTDRILNLTVYPYYHAASNIKGTIHVLRDITDEKENEMRLIMTERLAALGEMASGLAHEINNPLASIAGCAEGLSNRTKKNEFDPEFFNEYLGIMEEEILRCKNITTNMLSFVRRTTVRQEADISKILDRTVDIIGLQGRLKNISVVRDYGENVPSILANESELRQVFMAIISNALDAMNDSGTLTLRTSTEVESVVVEISDTGPGIPQHLRDRIFDPFFTNKAETGGTGLGLSIARKIISAAGGEISTTSEEGMGATIRVVLPTKHPE